MKKIICIILLINLLCGCEEFFTSEVEAPRQSTQPQLVIHGYISPQNSEIKVSVSLSIPMFGKQINQAKIVTDAQVILRNDQNQSVKLLYDEDKEYYVAQTNTFPIVAGKIYQLEVQDTQGNRATAECTVPEEIAGNIQNIQVIKTKDAESDAFQVAFNFRDTPNVRNYYIAEAWAETDNGYFKRKAEIKQFTDNNRDGQIISVRSEKTSGEAENVQGVEIVLLSVDYNYYQYFKTVSMQSDTESLGAFSEPVFILSNIKGGLGVFGAYNEKRVIVEF